MAIHPLVREVVDDYLAAVDAEVPRLIEGLYLVGSVALDDFRPQASDIDFVAVSESPLSEADIVALVRAHGVLAACRPRPFLDGAYVTWRDLSVDPSLAGPGAGVHRGRLHRRGAGGCGPV